MQESQLWTPIVLGAVQFGTRSGVIRAQNKMRNSPCLNMAYNPDRKETRGGHKAEREEATRKLVLIAS